MSKITLPPLPEPAHKAEAVDGFLWPEAYTAEQVEAIRRETVQACAEAANQSLTSGRSPFGGRVKAAILALLPKEPKE